MCVVGISVIVVRRRLPPLLIRECNWPAGEEGRRRQSGEKEVRRRAVVVGGSSFLAETIC